ncbi:uncharacterized protein LOC9326190 [Arabidopsis lyrata subsp. lyrata]|uniref:uncharacterized protein LOC9326190 n=1 Tax=Arabidopsis lyrata subsp. lyrata TaxID=81972 RepID=UPI000A29BBDF|nr:uncharacterized protein LOC9326190 [Arabidopsis lyrata subsp. lyrata]|eukprot:XP_020868674.1 uncharacterized protein LOC9326190 [Arabidopsis lyrata subsp. lyrata]
MVEVVTITAEVVSSDHHLVVAAEETAPKGEETLSLAVAVKGRRKMVAEREEEVKEQAVKEEAVVVMEPKVVETAQAAVEVGTALDTVSGAVVVVGMEPRVVVDVGTALDAVSDVVVDAVVGKGEKGFPVKVL